MKLYTIKNKFSDEQLRDNNGDICIFQTEVAAHNYIIEYLSDNFWTVAELRR